MAGYGENDEAVDAAPFPGGNVPTVEPQQGQAASVLPLSGGGGSPLGWEGLWKGLTGEGFPDRAKGSHVGLGVPQVLTDMKESAKLPGKVYKGEGSDQEDVFKMTMDWLMPGAVFRSAAPVKKAWSYSSTPPPKPKTFMDGFRGEKSGNWVDDAPGTSDLKKMSRTLYEGEKRSGASVDEPQFKAFMGRLGVIAEDQGMAEGFHDQVIKALEHMEKRGVGGADAKDLLIVRDYMKEASLSTKDGERRLAKVLKDEIDGFMERNGVNLGPARKLWAKAKKSEEIEAAIELGQEASMSGAENGIKSQLMQIVRRELKKKDRSAYTKAELRAIAKVARGDAKLNTLRMFSHLGPGASGGNRFLGTLAGGTTGATAAGTVGYLLGGPEMAAATGAMGALGTAGMGNLAGRSALARMEQDAAALRAMMATGRTAPPVTPSFMSRAAPSAVPPVAGANAPMTQEEFKRMTREGRF
jgi:hypothetical protein